MNLPVPLIFMLACLWITLMLSGICQHSIMYVCSHIIVCWNCLGDFTPLLDNSPSYPLHYCLSVPLKIVIRPNMPQFKLRISEMLFKNTFTLFNYILQAMWLSSRFQKKSASLVQLTGSTENPSMLSQLKFQAFECALRHRSLFQPIVRKMSAFSNCPVSHRD